MRPGVKALPDETWIGRTLSYKAWMKIKVSTSKNSMTMQSLTLHQIVTPSTSHGNHFCL